MKSLVSIAIFVVIGVTLAAPIHDDDVPEWERKHPYCHSCTQTVTELCMLRSHAHCAEFLQVSGQDLCERIGTYELCWAVIENKAVADTMVVSNRASVPAICRALELCR
ncbi:hypothetical protein Ddc_24393 [Ditylenchus destructor]|nr:hypothetical protein Ddc_24393 [Ditylenchus destructor]